MVHTFLYLQHKIFGEAVNRRNEKKAFSEAASFFPFRHPLWDYQGRAAPFLQRRRPPPAAETGRSCWGRGQQDTSAAQGTKWTLGTATRRIQRVEIAGGFLVLFWRQKRTLALNERALWPAPPARKAFQKPFLVLFWRAKENFSSAL